MASVVSMSELSRGMILELDGGLWTVMEFQNFKTGKGNSEARMRMKLRNLATGYTQDRTFRMDERVAKAAVESRPAQYTYNEGDMYHFMDQETYEEKLANKGTLGDAAYYLTDGLELQLVMYKDQPISVQLPITVDLKVADTEPGFKGDTATAGSKKATTETGKLVDVPMFANKGDVVRLDPRTGT